MELVSYNEFYEQIKRLSTAFCKSMSESFLEQFVETWHNQWKAQFPESSVHILEKMVDKAISDFERMPPFSQFKTLHHAVMGSIPVQGYAKKGCFQCSGSGLIMAWKHIESHGYSASFAFRCGRCENWRGKHDGLPAWTDVYEDQHGYTTGEIPRQSGKTAKQYIPKTIKPLNGNSELLEMDKKQIRESILRKEKERELEIPFL